MMAKWYSGTVGAQSYLKFVLQVRKNSEKTSLRKLVPTRDRTRARCVTDMHATAWLTVVDMWRICSALLQLVLHNNVRTKFTIHVRNDVLVLSGRLKTYPATCHSSFSNMAPISCQIFCFEFKWMWDLHKLYFSVSPINKNNRHWNLDTLL